MKKEYMIPESKVIAIVTQYLLSASNPKLNGGEYGGDNGEIKLSPYFFEEEEEEDW